MYGVEGLGVDGWRQDRRVRRVVWCFLLFTSRLLRNILSAAVARGHTLIWPYVAVHRGLPVPELRQICGLR